MINLGISVASFSESDLERFCWEFTKSKTHLPWLRQGFTGQYTHVESEISDRHKATRIISSSIMVCYPQPTGGLIGASYFSTEVQSVYSTAPANKALRISDIYCVWSKCYWYYVSQYYPFYIPHQVCWWGGWLDTQ